MLLTCRHVRLFATAQAARVHQAAHPKAWCTTFFALMQAFGGPQEGQDGVVLRSIDVMMTRLIMRGLKQPPSAAPAHPNSDVSITQDISDVSARRFSELRATCRALLTLRAAGITAHHKKQMPAASPSVAALLSDLGAYEEALAQHHLADTADIQRGALLRAASNIWPDHLHALEHITVEPGVQVFDLRRDLLRVLAARGVQVTVRLPYSPTNPGTTPWAEAMLHGFEAQQRGGVHFSFESPTKNAGVAGAPLPLGEALVQSLTEAAQDPSWLQRHHSDAAHAVQLVQVPPGDALITYVHKTLHTWWRQGISPADMAVVLPRSSTQALGLRPEQVGPALVRALGASGLPCHLTAGPPLLESPGGKRLACVLRLALQLEALPPPPPGQLFDEAGIQLADWASGLQQTGETVVVPLGDGEKILTPLGQANLLRRCGHRRLGPKGLRRALAALRGVGREVAYATAQAAENWLHRWAVPLTGGQRPLTERVQHLLQLGHHVASQNAAASQGIKSGGASVDVVDAATDTALAAALTHLATTAQQWAPATHTSLVEASGWVHGVLSEQRGPRLDSNLGAQGVAIVSPQDIVGLRFSHVLALGLNNLPTGPTTGPLSETSRREFNQALGYKLLQYGAVTGRAPLPLGAEQQFYFYEILRTVTVHLCAVVVQFADEELAQPDPNLQRLQDMLQVKPVTPHAIEAGPWHEEPTTALQLRSLLQARALPWALEAAPKAALLARLQASAERLGPQFWRSRQRLNSAHAQALSHTVLTQVVGVSSLDQLAMCQYRYFAGPMLGLSHELHPEHHIDRRRAGEAAHRALFHVYSALLHDRPWTAWAAEPAATLAHAERTFAAQEQLILPTAWVHEDLRKGALAAVWHTVHTQLLRDLANIDAVPAALEYRFGDPVRTDRPALQLQHPQDATRVLRVRGSIDRVDLGAGLVQVIDYKSSLPKRHPDRHVQLGLYQAVALRDFLPQAHATSASWLLLGQPAQGASSRQPEELAGHVADILRRTQEAVWRRLDTFLSGVIEPDPAPVDLCTHCDFIHLCRYSVDPTGETSLDAQATEVEAP